MRRLVLAFLASTLLVSCGESFTLTVDVRTDLLAGVEFVEVRTRRLEGPPATVHAVEAGLDYGEGARVAELLVDAGPVELEVELRDADGAVVLQRPLVVDVQGPTGTTVVFTRDCQDVECSAGAPACLGGACVSAECTPEQPARCDAQQCQNNSDCDDRSRPMCARPTCVAGACLYRPEDDRCGPTELCNPALGCRPADDPFRCPPPDEDTVLLLDFDGETAADALGANPGELVGPASFADGPAGCGRALSIPAAELAYAEVPDDPVWHLDEGSVDFWVRPPTGLGQSAGVVSRDANLAGGGHFSVLLDRNGALVVRVQSSTGSEVSLCAPPLELGRWHHAGVSFGGAEGLALWVDGEPVETRGALTLRDVEGSVRLDCAGGSLGLRPADALPWILGASAVRRVAGVRDAHDPLAGGRIDHFRVSRVRRDFGR